MKCHIYLLTHALREDKNDQNSSEKIHEKIFLHFKKHRFHLTVYLVLELTLKQIPKFRITRTIYEDSIHVDIFIKRFSTIKAETLKKLKENSTFNTLICHVIKHELIHRR